MVGIPEIDCTDGVPFRTVAAMRKLLLAVALASSLPLAAATPPLDGKVDRYLAPLVKSGELNGLVLIARGDQILARRIYGKADWDLNAPLAEGSRFRVASITKTFTASAFTLLAERHKLAYDDPLSKYIPDFPNGDKIRIRHLLLHQSGVPNPDAPPCSSATLDDLVAELAKKPLWFEPGKASGYSNGGYALLARVIERASGEPWETFLRRNIFEPLALTETSIDHRADIVPMRARGFVPAPGVAGVEHAGCEGGWAAIGSGAVVSSARDLVKWGRAVRNETLFKRRALEYPYGWGVRKYFEHAAIEQSGILSGFASYLAVYPDDDLYVVVLSNVQTGALNDAGKGLGAIALGAEPPKLVASPPIVTATAEERRRWVGQFRNANIATVAIAERDGALGLRWESSPETVFIGSTGPSAAYDREDSVGMELAPDGDSLGMRWGSGEWQEFKRLREAVR
jgi:CubicO group peptidase (beta-lactamase class C family)